ncbi:MAG: segregation/condensation protein A [Gammaproteobacteria bacterium]|nr:segregation/condensation protein A [Gammaproteobacteria bacterium]
MADDSMNRSTAELSLEANADSSYQVRVGDKDLDELPSDLHVPPDAMIVMLESFEGPLDLLLYLIRKQNLDILEIRLADIADQYMQYIELMSTLRLQLAGEYLVIAATLMVIKSRALLPQLENEDEEETNPEADLRRRLQEYERLKNASERLDALPRVDREVHVVHGPLAQAFAPEVQPEIELRDLMVAFADVIERSKLYQRHRITRTTISVRERMTDIIGKLEKTDEFLPFDKLFDVREGKVSLIASFLAILELMRSSLVRLTQQQPFAPIFVGLAEEASVG